MRPWHLALLALILALGVAGCSESTSPEPSGLLPSEAQPLALAIPEPCGDPLEVPLLAERSNLQIGTVTVANDATQLAVTFVATGGWVLQTTRIEVASAGGRSPLPPGAISRLRGVVRTGSHKPPLAQVEYTVTLAKARVAPGDILYVSAQTSATLFDGAGRPRSKVVARAGTDSFSGGGGAKLFPYIVQSCEPQGPCRLQVVWPNGGEGLCVGDSVAVSWVREGGCADVVRIELLQEGQFALLLADAAPNTGSFLWEGLTQRGAEPEGYAIRLSFPTGTAADVSDGTFEIIQCGGPE
jgi:hypothetical protein